MPDFPLKKSMFMRAERTAPSAWFAHIPFAGWLIESFRPRMLVELGAHHGTSYLAFCQAIVANDVMCKSFAVDTWTGDEHSGEYGEEVYEQLHAYHSRKYGGFSELLRMTFDEAAGYFEDGSIDLLHVDGLHTYEAVKHDFEKWFPKLSDRAVVLFHDTSVREREFGVWRFWHELEQSHRSFEFTHGHGLGVLSLGSDAPPDLAPLFSPEADEGLIRGVFERLGSCIEVDAELERVNRALVHERSLNRDQAERDRTEINSAFENVRHDVAHVKHAMAADLGKIATAVEGIASQCMDLRDESAATRAALADAASRQVDIDGVEQAVSGGLEVLRNALVQSATQSQTELTAHVDVLRRDLVAVRAQLLAEAETALAGVHRILTAQGECLGELDARAERLHEQGDQTTRRLETLVLQLTELGQTLDDREQRKWSRKLLRWIRPVPSGMQGRTLK